MLVPLIFAKTIFRLFIKIIDKIGLFKCLIMVNFRFFVLFYYVILSLGQIKYFLGGT